MDFGEPVISKRAHGRVEMSEQGTCVRHEIDTAGNDGIFAMRAGPKTGEPYLPELSVGGNPAIPNGIFAEVGGAKQAGSPGDNPGIPNAIAAQVGEPKYTSGVRADRIAEFAGEGGLKEPMLKGDCVANRLKHPAIAMSKRTDVPWVPFI